ncbi:MAG: lipopolysaccharide heptosyltransferase II [Oceanospirillaceae bacterium]|nr:lipopolysaccharide heptosyltransferase II [Oceanospirillaceae bacterium]
MNILVVGPSWVGDMVMSQSLLLRLKADHPDCNIDVLAPDWCRPVLARMPQINQAIAMPVGHGSLQWSVRKELASTLSAKGYDQAIVLPNSLKSALVPWMAKIPRRTGWHGEMRYGLLNDRRKLDTTAFPLMVQRYIALAEPKKDSATELQQLLRPKLTVDLSQQQAVCEQFSLNNDVVAFCPGAEFGPAKRWPHFHFAKLASLLIAEGKQIFCLGSAKDSAAIGQIKSLLSEVELGKFVDVSGQTSLTQAIDILAKAQAIVSNDSGLMHIGAAVGTPLVALYGPTSPDFTPPLSDNCEVIRLIDGFIKARKGDAEQGYHQSMIDITPQLVLEKLQLLGVQCEY